MGIQKKIVYGYLAATSCVLIIGWLIFAALSVVLLIRWEKEDLQQTAEMLAEQLQIKTDRQLNIAKTCSMLESVKNEVRLQNQTYAGLTLDEVYKKIQAVDTQWLEEGMQAKAVLQKVLVGAACAQMRQIMELEKGSVAEIFVTDQYGAVAAATNKTTDYDQSDESWWQRSFNRGRGQSVIGELEYDKSSRAYSMAFSFPILDEDEAIGVLKMVVTAQSLFDFISHAKEGKTGEAFLCDLAGKVLFGRGHTYLEKEVAALQIRHTRKLLGSLHEVGDTHSVVVGATRIPSFLESSAKTPSGKKMEVVMVRRTTEALTPFFRLTAAFWGTAIPFMLILSLLLEALSRRLLNPLLRFKEICNKIAAGEEVHNIEMIRDEESSQILRRILFLVEEEKQFPQEEKDTTQEPTLQKFYPQLLEAEKLKLLSDGLRGVIHELNNPLTSVLGFTELLLEELASEKTAGTAAKIYSEAKRCRKIIDDLQAFIRRPTGGFKELVSVNDLVERACFMRSHLWRTRHLEVQKELASDLPICVADPIQLQQALLCLLANAEDSIAEAAESQQKTFEGNITIQTEAQGDWVRVRIEDNGCGISSENLVKIFNPFFSTKPGKLGLGLNLASFLVKQQGGSIQALSRKGAGAVFILEIPAAAQPSLPEEKESEKPIRKAS